MRSATSFLIIAALAACGTPTGGGTADDALKLGGLAPDAYQRRVTGFCPAGQFAQSVAADGTVTCGAPVSSMGGDVTAVNTATGSGLTGGAATGDISVALISCPPGNVLKRTSGAVWDCAADSDSLAGLNCSAGQVAKFASGAWACGTDDVGGGAGIGSVAAGVNSGLAATTSSGAVTVGLATCPSGQILKSQGSGQWVCAADVDTTFAAGTGLSLGGGQYSVNFPPAGGDNGSANLATRSDHLHDARYAQLPFTTIVVRANGTALQNGYALISAINGISDASLTKPYLLKLEPGIYDVGTISYVGKAYVDLEGSGRAVTRIQGATVNSVVNMDYNSEVRELSITHQGGVANASALWFSVQAGYTTAARRVNVANVGGTTTTMGIFMGGTGDALIEDCDVNVTTAAGGVYGVRAPGAGTQLTIRRSRVIAAGPAVQGVLGSGSRLELEAVSISVIDTGTSSGANGVSNYPASGGLLIARDVSVVAQASNSGCTALGLVSQATVVLIEGGSFIARGTNANGLYFSTSNVTARGTLVEATATVAGQGISYNPSGAATFISRFDHGRILSSGGSGSAPIVLQALSGATATLSVAGSQIASAQSPVNSGVTLRCVQNYDENDAVLNASCL